MKYKNEIILFSYSSIIFLCFYHLIGYSLVQWPEIDNFHFFHRYFDNDFLKNDFTVDSVANHNPRNVFQYFVILLTKLTFQSWQKILFLIDLTSRIILPVLLYKNVIIYSKIVYPSINKNFIFLSFILLITLSYYNLSFFNVGGFEFHMFGFHSSILSLIFLSSGLILNQMPSKLAYFSSLIILSFGTFLHPVFGILFFIFYLLSINPLINKNQYIITLLFSLIFPLIGLKIIFNDSILNVEDFNDLYIYYRHPHHYQISHIFSSSYEIIKFLGYNIFLLIPYVFFKSKKLLIIPVLLTLIMMLQFIFIEVYPIKLFSILGLNRIYFFLPLLIIVYFSYLPFLKKIEIRYFSKKIIIIPILILLYFSLTTNEFTLMKGKDNLKLNSFLKTIDDDDIIFIDQFRLDAAEISVINKKRIYIINIFPFSENYFKEYYRRYFFKKNNNFIHDDINTMKDENIKYILTNKKIESNLVELVYINQNDKAYKIVH